MKMGILIYLRAKMWLMIVWSVLVETYEEELEKGTTHWETIREKALSIQAKINLLKQD